MQGGVPSIQSWLELGSVGTHVLLQQIPAEFLQQWKPAAGEIMVGGGKIRMGGFEFYQKNPNASFPQLKRVT